MGENIYNFLDNKLNPRLAANCPATDGYEIGNLISENLKEKSKGFLAYSAIKPPIDIDFEFICSINIYYILIWTTVDSQKSTGFEIFVKKHNVDFTTASKVFTDHSGIVLYKGKHLSVIQKRDIPKDFDVHYSRSNAYALMSSAEKIRLRILRTKSSVPCIGRIEVWGCPSRICSDVTKKTIEKLCNLRPRPVATIEQSLMLPASSKIDEQLFNIPEEYIDPISCEMMTIPVTLPSGKTIDKSTLEKHHESEAKWGRQPSDPFTGQVFTPLRQPILNTALKSRIDEFLFKNAHRPETFQIQRTVGGNKSQRRTANISNIITPQSKNGNEVQPCSSNSVNLNLDDVINNAIKQYNIVRFSSDDNNHLSNNENECGDCKSDKNLYILNCDHLICRTCLIRNSVDVSCNICKSVSCKNSAKKFHEGKTSVK